MDENQNPQKIQNRVFFDPSFVPNYFGHDGVCRLLMAECDVYAFILFS